MHTTVAPVISAVSKTCSQLKKKNGKSLDWNKFPLTHIENRKFARLHFYDESLIVVKVL